MFVHAVESFEHGIEHYVDRTPRSRKFAILHIDHAIELFLKEKAVSLGKSIYKSDGQTLSLHETLRSLRDLEIPEQPRLEEIHDLRNTIQHKGLVPDELTTQFSIEVAYSFLRRFLPAELGVEVDTLFQKRVIAVMEGLPPAVSADSRQALRSARQCKSSTEAIVRAYTVLEQVARRAGDEKLGGLFRRTVRQLATDRGAPPDTTNRLLDELMSIRNRAVHSPDVPTDADAKRFVHLTEELLSLIGG